MQAIVLFSSPMAADSDSSKLDAPLINPWLLLFQKLGLELKCPLCLNLFNQPTLVPCNHIFCSSCIARMTKPGSECPVCTKPYTELALRPAPYMDSIVKIYRSLDASLGNMFQPDAARVSGQYPTSLAQLKAVVPATIKLNQVVAQTSHGCPPSNGNVKGSNDDSSYKGSDHVRPIMQDHERDFKRQKKLSDGSAVILNSELQIEPVVFSGAEVSTIFEDLVGSNTICGFCQSSRLSEDTGEMLHYVCGKPVEGHQANNPDALHVHSKCIEWAPQVYFVGETIQNLDKELARGAKLKCFKCGIKGAALGCYAKSCRRTYHFPCALKADCRWETENYLILCPTHSKQKFPNEKKSKSRNQALDNQPMPTQIASEKANLQGGLPSGTNGWVFCGSALSSAEKLLLLEFARTSGAIVSKFWRPDVTHVIAATDADGACTRTLKVLSAILNGRWVLKIDWIKACMEAKRLVDEEPYEVNHDNHGCSNGPKAGRLRVLNNAPKLFDGLKFYFCGDFMPGYKYDLQNLVSCGGGVVLNSKEDLVADDQRTPSSILVVYNIDPPQGCKLGDEFSILWERLNEARDSAAKTGSQVVGHTWILESITSCSLQPIS